MTTLSVILPVYNEASTIGHVIDEVLEKGTAAADLELIIVESRSTDGTDAIVDGYRRHPLVRVIHQDAAKGKGNAVREGLRHATGDIILIQDGDLEYRVEDYPLLLGPILDGRTDFVLGCRHVPGRPMREFAGNRRLSRMLNIGHWVFTWMFNIVYGTLLRDPFTMYKVFRRECVDGMIFMSDRFDFDWELVAKLVRRGYRPLEVPITYQSRGFEDGKKVQAFRDPLTWLVALVRFRFAPIPPRRTKAALALAPTSEPSAVDIDLSARASSGR